MSWLARSRGKAKLCIRRYVVAVRGEVWIKGRYRDAERARLL